MAIPPFGSPPTPPATSTVAGKIKLAGDLTGTSSAPTIKSSVNLTGSPTTTTQPQSDNSTDIATTAYVTAAVAAAVAGVNPAVAVQAATAAVLPNSPTYNNGVSGIGATLTAGVTNTTLVVDGYTPVLNDRILVKNQASTFQNGVYFVSQVAALGLAWILTRALDYDQPSDINNTGAIPVINGTVNIDTSWVLTSKVTTVGTDPLTFTQFTLNPSTIITNSTAAGGDLTGTYPNPTLLTSVNPNVGTFGSATQVAQVTVNAKGQVTGVTNVTIVVPSSALDSFLLMGA